MEISFVCFKAVQNIAFHKFSPSGSAWDGGLDVRGFIEELFYQERRDWWERAAWCVTHSGYELLQPQLESFTDQMHLMLKDAGSITLDWAKMAAVTST